MTAYGTSAAMVTAVQLIVGLWEGAIAPSQSCMRLQDALPNPLRWTSGLK